jgi:hypothetical protein
MTVQLMLYFRDLFLDLLTFRLVAHYAPDLWMPYAPAIKVKGGTTFTSRV